MRLIWGVAVFLSAALAAAGASPLQTAPETQSSLPSCPARASRIGEESIHWISGPREDQPALEQWCRAVGQPLYFPAPTEAPVDGPPALDDLVVVTWNAHLSEGRLPDLVGALRGGRLTGEPVENFVLLVQELYRRGAEVPPFDGQARSAFAIRARDPLAPDVRDQARALGLSMLYVPSMRNGAELLEDRGNAILSTEPITAAIAFELPLERQRRVVVGAAVPVIDDGVVGTLRVFNAHLEPLSSPKSLWVFRNPRRRQMESLLTLLNASRFEHDVTWVGTVLGGDFNTVQGGVEETAYQRARGWGHSIVHEDDRRTHSMGRLDYLFFRLAPGWLGATTRLDEKFGSDHYPVLGRFSPVATE